LSGSLAVYALEPLSKSVLRAAFERVLDGILAGKMYAAPEGNGPGGQTNAAPNDLAGESAAAQPRPALREQIRVTSCPPNGGKATGSMLGGQVSIH
jgi:hypothetical protein